MEITLEKIELVKDRTGVSYKEAKEALEKADGEVVDAIILIENQVNVETPDDSTINQIISKIKEFVNKGNITKISVKRGEETLLNIPLNVGIIGALVAPYGIIAALIASFGFKCKIELTTTEGNVIDVSKKVKDVAGDIQEKGEVIWDYAKEKAPEVIDYAKEKGEVAWNFAKEKAPEVKNFAKEKGGAAWEFAKEKGSDAWNFAKEKAPEVKEFAKEKGTDAWEFAKEKLEERKEAGKMTETFSEIDFDKDVIEAELNGEEE